MRIVLDAMGSDNAPGPEIDGAIDASRDDALEILMVGDSTVLNPALQARRARPNIRVVHASEAIGMHEQPVMAVRKKKDASLLVGLRLIKRGEADAFVSAGNTGAVMVASRTILSPLKGVSRSAICQFLPTLKRPVVMLDLGANVDCTARHLCEFAEMGMVCAQRMLNIPEPRVGLLNIGEEQVKGNEVAKNVHRNLSREPHINFIGNVEPKRIFAGDADVVVCDGFVGNVVLKTSEAAASLMGQLLKKEIQKSWLSKLGALLARGAFQRLKQDVDPNEYPGAYLLGVNGLVLILHGSTTARGVSNAIRGARQAAAARLNDHINSGLEQLREAEARLAAEG